MINGINHIDHSGIDVILAELQRCVKNNPDATYNIAIMDCGEMKHAPPVQKFPFVPWEKN